MGKRGFFLLLCVLAWASLAHAQRTTREEQYLLTVGAGIAHPSVLYAPRDNPAIYSQNQHFKIQALGLLQNSNFSAGTAGFHLMAGNGLLGGQLGVEVGLPGAASINVMGGFGVEIRPIRTAMGLQCQLGLAGGISVGCTQIGVLVNPEGGFRWGTVVGRPGVLLASPVPVSTGIALDLGRHIVLALDAGSAFGGAMTSNWGFNVLPALGIRTQILDLNAGWGVPVLTSGGAGGNSAVPLGLVAALGLRLGKRVYVSAGTNDSAWAWMQTTIRF